MTGQGPECRRLRAEISGAVQGVGFRPFVYRLARELQLAGWVRNSMQGVTVEVEGPADRLETFLERLSRERPPRAAIYGMETVVLDPCGLAGFQIQASRDDARPAAVVLPDIATCAECCRELFSPADRRYRYPFTNCTNCGPRFTIIRRLPYDRPNTTMAGFGMCADCLAEYHDPANRRFHAQPNACPACGPQVQLWDDAGRVLAVGEAALAGAEAALRDGRVVAVKGLGGFHLMVDARQGAAVARLRAAKNRETKPFALMYPDLEAVRRHCRVSRLEERLLTAPEAPIVLLERHGCSGELAPEVAPDSPLLGVLLPYTPLHHLLLADLAMPVVATSGNRADEPICTAAEEALIRLRGIATLFLVHDRPIARHVDDSVVRVVAGRELVLRRARGYAPLPVGRAAPGPDVVAVGAQLKNAVCVVAGGRNVMGQHIGDLDTPAALAALRRSIEDLCGLYAVKAEIVAADLHPDYASTVLARTLAAAGAPLVSVQHHHAHVAACMAENELDGEVLGVAWDGMGLGLDGTIWGGEFLAATRRECTRVAHLRPFRLPGSEQAIREPRRTALGLLYELWGEAALDRLDLAPLRAFSPAERRVLGQMLRRRVNSPVTTSAGRLFDAVASLCDLCQRLGHEGQAAMALEHRLDGDEAGAYPTALSAGEGGALVLDWEPMVRELVRDVTAGVPAGRVSARFHNGLAAGIVSVCVRAGRERVVLTGGCLQNRHLVERSVALLRAAGLRPYWHQRVPPNDGGIALGQAAIARSRAAAAAGAV